MDGSLPPPITDHALYDKEGSPMQTVFGPASDASSPLNRQLYIIMEV